LNAALKQIEQYNEDAKNEIRVTQREAEATKDVVRKIGKEKDEQDYLISDLENTLKQREDERLLLVAQLGAQEKERNTAEVCRCCQSRYLMGFCIGGTGSSVS